jgi:regulator of protease activity HflC (stomatin/prohibitin superfamily)
MLLPWVLVPQQNRFILERFGRFSKVLKPGLNFKIPVLDMVAYKHSLKEQVINVDSQNAITRDNVKLRIDGVLYYKFFDPWKASYNVKNPITALSLLAQTSMRSEIGKIDLDRTFEERETLNAKIRVTVGHASEMWGIECMRYEIKDISPPEQIRRSMELQAESERIKRSKILNSEGERQALINIAEGDKSAAVLEGEGVATKIMQEARAIVEALENIAQAIEKDEKMVALKLKLTERYLETMADILDKSKLIVIPPSSQNGNSDMTRQIALGLNLYKNIMDGSGMNFSSMATGSDQTYQELNKKLESLKEERRKTNDRSGRSSDKYEFMDDKILYSTE